MPLFILHSSCATICRATSAEALRTHKQLAHEFTPGVGSHRLCDISAVVLAPVPIVAIRKLVMGYRLSLTCRLWSLRMPCHPRTWRVTCHLMPPPIALVRPWRSPPSSSSQRSMVCSVVSYLKHLFDVECASPRPQVQFGALSLESWSLGVSGSQQPVALLCTL